MDAEKTYQTKYEYRELSLLFDISQDLSRSLDLKEVFGKMLRSMADHLGMLRGTVTILNRETKEIVIEEAYDLTMEERERGRYKIGEGITGHVVQTGEPVVVPRISLEKRFLNKTRARKKEGIHDLSFICVPIQLGQEVIGTLSFDKPYNDHPSTERDLHLVTVIASLIAQALKLRQSAQEKIRYLQNENQHLQEELRQKYHPSHMIGKSGKMHEAYHLIESVLNNRTTVLIRGESGVGKELVAQAIHYNGIRSGKSFIKVNCAALPENLIESELFGHEKGAFTGAMNARKGRFEEADGGTIFLDEIGDFPLQIQIKLLRVIQEREIERLGSSRPIPVDVRLICATNRNLEELMVAGYFRQDLYYRINVFPIYVPSLRERKTDIMELANFFVEKYSEMIGKSIKRISTSAIDMMMSYHWPGNVRELENCIERAIILSNDGVIHGYNLPPTLQTAEASGTGRIGSLESVMNNVEKDMLIDALKINNGNMVKSADMLGITERMIGIRIKKYGINLREFKAHNL